MAPKSVPVPINAAAVPPQIGSTKQRVWPHAVSVGDTIFVSAQAGVGIDGSLVSDATTPQFHQALENVRLILESAGFSFSDVVKVRILVPEVADYERLQGARNPYYQQHFPKGDYPASTALMVRELSRPGSRVEIDVVACKRKRMFDAPGRIVKIIPLDLDAQPLWRLGGDTGELLWTTGQPGLDLQARLVGAAAAQQLARSLDNLGWILEAGEFDWNAVSKLNLFLARIADHESARAVLDRFLSERFPGGDFPACSLLEGGMPGPGMIVEAEVIASRVGPRRIATCSPPSTSASLSSTASSMGGWAMSSLHAGQGSRDVRQQAADALARMTAALGEVGSDAKNLAHVTIWLSDLAATQAVTEICGSLLPALPATTIVRTSFPSPGALVGVEGIAG